MNPSLNAAAKWIVKNTLVSNESLTPEIKLRLITAASPLWMKRPDDCPLPNPYWAFYWPGGQALTRYVLDNSSRFRNSRIFDFGAGCGAGAIAAELCGAKKILANDIDKYALLSTKLNFHLNKISDSKIVYSSKNYLSDKDANIDEYFKGESNGRFIFLGDMFYDTDFAETLFSWLKGVQDKFGVTVLVGDPNRHPLADEEHIKGYTTQFKKTEVEKYPLPGYITATSYGFDTAKVFELSF